MTQMGPDAIHMQELILFACASAFAASSPIAEGVRGRFLAGSQEPAKMTLDRCIKQVAPGSSRVGETNYWI